nr:condensin-2 complex subunit H2 [Ipomoea batatas]
MKHSGSMAYACDIIWPRNLVVLEGDCLDPTGDAGELRAATNLFSMEKTYRIRALTIMKTMRTMNYDNGESIDLRHADFDMRQRLLNSNEDEHWAKRKTIEGHEDPYSHSTLEDLCRSFAECFFLGILLITSTGRLNTWWGNRFFATYRTLFLANLLETRAPKTEWAARRDPTDGEVFFRDRNLHPPFDIHEYGEKINQAVDSTVKLGKGGSRCHTKVAEEKKVQTVWNQ